ncbi:uncharacterized protein psd isoform X2 [Drosophila takahashii]|uniref:uncharacterized protein psd isoform X2 n=1 Tax=Drosophila takahashii TaxID=29030 RepID=UPI0038996D7B
MLNWRKRSWTLTLLAMVFILSTSAQEGGMSNRIATPGEPLYYLMADAGPLVTPNESLRRTNRSLLKWWDDLFPRNNNCCSSNVVYPPAPLAPAPTVANNCNGLQLQDLDPFKQMKLFKKLPELFPSPNPCVQCAGSCGQLPQKENNYGPQSPSFGGDGYGVPPSAEIVKPNPEYNGPGDGDAGFVAPPAPSFEAPAPPVQTYEAPEPPAPSYEASAADYNTPAPPAFIYDPIAPIYNQPERPSEVYRKTQEYAQPSYVGAQPPQIVYQPIIYVSTPLASQSSYHAEIDDQSCQQPAAPPKPSYATQSCQTPIRLSLIDQPYRVAPELFEEYNYRLALASQNIL